MTTHERDPSVQEEVLAYWPQRRLQDAIYGSVWACLVLRRHHGIAADDAARAAGVEPGSASAPIVWEISGQHVAIKMVEWARVHHMRGRLLEDPVKEVAAMQLLGARHPNVLGSTEVLQDGDFLYSIMPYCRDGDLFGVVVQYAEDSGGESGMPEPVARFWFRQILWVRKM
jgi:serine/threonine protein kinase